MEYVIRLWVCVPVMMDTQEKTAVLVNCSSDTTIHTVCRRETLYIHIRLTVFSMVHGCVFICSGTSEQGKLWG